MLIEDARRDGHHLRVTWHPDKRQFVLSTWTSDVCTGASRVAVEDAAELTSLLVDGLADAAKRPEAAAPSAPPVPSTRPGLAGMVDRMRWLVRGTPPSTPPAGAATGHAHVHPLRRNSA